MEASRDCLKRVTTRGPRSRPHTTAGLHIWIGIAFQVCRNCELFLTGECLAEEAVSICAPRGNSLRSILILVTRPGMQLSAGFTASQAGRVNEE